MNLLNIYAAGSLRYAFSELAERFEMHYSQKVAIQFSPAGLLCKKIQQECNNPFSHLFASANCLHPQRLVDLQLAKKQQVFAHNRLCMTIRNNKGWGTQHWLDILLDSKMRIGISTPQNDPSGDYAFSLFDHIERLYAGEGLRLKQRAVQWVGGGLKPSLPMATLPAEYLILNDKIDIFIGYANYKAKLMNNTQLRVIDIPDEYYESIDYSIALLNHRHNKAQFFIDFLLGQKGQDCLQQHGFVKLD